MHPNKRKYYVVTSFISVSKHVCSKRSTREAEVGQTMHRSTA